MALDPHAIKVHPLVARVLARRGVSTPDAARRYLSPRLVDLTRPDAMADRDVAADRIVHAIKHHERITVFGDYDVDGITSATLLTRVLRRLGATVNARVASRFEGGYGLSDVAVDQVLGDSPSLVITCDCGTSDHARLERLRALHIDTIVVDHHKVPEAPLPARAFLNPHRPECGFAYKHMASVGLAFSIAAAVRARLEATLDLRPLLDIVALGTIADVAPLHGDNRILTRVGLTRIADGEASPGVRALMAEVKLRHRLTARDVSFQIAPRLNAPGRLGSAMPTLALLLEDDPQQAAALARALSDANDRRREISAKLIDAAQRQVHEVYGATLPQGIVVAGDGWHHGMGGIVAGRLVDRLGVAVAVVSIEGEVGVGSVRAPRGVKLFDAIAACREELLVFGGHDAAAGLRVRRERVDAFRAAFATAVAGAPRSVLEGAPIDTELTEADLGADLARDLGSLEPTGEGNADPLVRVQGARVNDLRVVGDEHLRASFALGRRALGGFVRDGVARRERGELSAVGSHVDLVARLRPDPWNGAEAVQLEEIVFQRA
jgi:single-stranded-DNA-specific exonuclease